MTDETKTGPVMADTIAEVQGVFPSNDAMEEAIGKLTLLGIDRADLSLPVTDPVASYATPEQAASNPTTDTDTRQLHALAGGIALAVGGMAAAAATVVTGGAALAAGAALAVGAGAAGVTEATQRGVESSEADERNERARRGELILAVHLRDPGQAGPVTAAMQQAGATGVASVERSHAEISSASWAGG